MEAVVHFIKSHSRLLLFQLPFTAIFIALLLWRVDIGEAFARLRTLDVPWVAAALAAFTLSKSIHAYRWRQFLYYRDLPFGGMFGVFLISNFVNGLIPFRVGDLLRVEVPSRRYGVSRAELTSSVFIVESVLDGIAFAILAAVATLFIDLPPLLASLLPIVGALAFVLFVGSVLLAHADVDREWGDVWPVRLLPQRARDFLATGIPQFLEGMRSLRTVRAALAALALSVFAWTIEISVYWLLARGFGVELGVPQALIVMIAGNLIVSLPIVPWDIGPYEVAVTETLVLLGVPRGGASAFAIGSHVLLQGWVAVTGLVAMYALGISLRDVLPGRLGGRRQAQPDEAPDEEGEHAESCGPPARAAR